MRTIWVGAIAVAVACYGALVAYGGQSEVPQKMRDADRAFVGSSLTRSAFPYEDDVKDIFGDGRKHVRLARGGIDGKRMTELLSAAVAAGIEEIYVEIYPYIRSKKPRPRDIRRQLAAEPVWTGGLAPLWSGRIKQYGRMARNGIRTTFGIAPEGIVSSVYTNDKKMDNVFDGDGGDLSKRFPADYHPPKNPEELRSVIAEAEREGVKLVFMSYPHSQTIADFVGPESFAEMVDEMTVFSRDFGVEVWVPALTFSNEHFRDRAHLNRRGRERFLELFRKKFVSGNEHG